jgi:uncharacterized protein YecT (DUF1311 family)
MTQARAALLTLFLGAFAAPAVAQDLPCPHGTMDACDRLAYEKLDGELAQLVESKLVDIGRRSTFTDRVERAISSFSEAQREWRRFREAECKARPHVAILISARTLQGLTSACLLSLTKQRIEEIRRY